MSELAHSLAFCRIFFFLSGLTMIALLRKLCCCSDEEDDFGGWSFFSPSFCSQLYSLVLKTALVGWKLFSDHFFNFSFFFRPLRKIVGRRCRWCCACPSGKRERVRLFIYLFLEKFLSRSITFLLIPPCSLVVSLMVNGHCVILTLCAVCRFD